MTADDVRRIVREELAAALIQRDKPVQLVVAPVKLSKKAVSKLERVTKDELRSVLRSRESNCVASLGKTVLEIAMLSDEQLMKCPNLGLKGIAAIRYQIERIGET